MVRLAKNCIPWILVLLLSPTARGEPGRVLLISDIDDTVKYSRWASRGHGWEVFRNSVVARPFVGMPELYQALADNGVEIHYVSNALPVMELFNRRLRTRFGMPPGTLHYKTQLKGARDYKTAKIRQIMEANPDARVVLVGDNGEKDPGVFESLAADSALRERIAGRYLHDLYVNRSEGGGTPFFTAAELALHFHRQGLVDDPQLNRVLRAVHEGMTSEREGTQKRTIPAFADLRGVDFGKRFPTDGLTEENVRLVESLRSAVLRFASRAGGGDLCPDVYAQLRGQTPGTRP